MNIHRAHLDIHIYIETQCIDKSPSRYSYLHMICLYIALQSLVSLVSVKPLYIHLCVDMNIWWALWIFISTYEPDYICEPIRYSYLHMNRIRLYIALQCVAVCCSVLQCAAVCCSVLQCAAVRCSVLQCVAVCCSVLQCIAVCCSVLQCVAVCCSVLQCVAVRCLHSKSCLHIHIYLWTGFVNEYVDNSLNVNSWMYWTTHSKSCLHIHVYIRTGFVNEYVDSSLNVYSWMYWTTHSKSCLHIHIYLWIGFVCRGAMRSVPLPTNRCSFIST